MSARPVVVMEITALESVHLADLVRQFRALLQTTPDGPGPTQDPAVARLVPDAYADDAEASRQFRDLTESDLLRRRDDDALVVLASLGEVDADDAAAHPTRARSVALTAVELDAWLRTLAALRLVLASRLDIHTETDAEPDDPRFGVYEWLGYRLEGLVQAADGGA